MNILASNMLRQQIWGIIFISFYHDRNTNIYQITFPLHVCLLYKKFILHNFLSQNPWQSLNEYGRDQDLFLITDVNQCNAMLNNISVRLSQWWMNISYQSPI